MQKESSVVEKNVASSTELDFFNKTVSFENQSKKKSEDYINVMFSWDNAIWPRWISILCSGQFSFL